jgi:plasmid stabilization system protein ParE
MRIIWTEKAIVTFNQIADYLYERFSEKEVQRYFDRTDEIITSITITPYLFKPYKINSQIRHGILHKNVTLFYRVFEEAKVIELLLFWENHQSPDKLIL